MNSGGHSYSKDIYMKMFERRKQTLSMQIRGEISGDPEYQTFSAIHFSS